MSRLLQRQPALASIATASLAVFAATLPVGADEADDYVCGHCTTAVENPMTRSVPAVNDTLRALFVFARHTDALSGLDCGPDSIAWTDSTQVPAWADSLFDDTTNLSNWAPTNAPGLTHYFYEMSDPSNPHILLGRVYDKVVLADETIEYYDINEFRAWGGSNRDVLEQVDADTTFSFADFDFDDDDEVDFVFIYYWSPASTTPGPGGRWRLNASGGSTWTGISNLGLSSDLLVENGTMTIGFSGGATLTPRATVACTDTSVTRIRNRAWAFQIAVHEYLHDLFAVAWSEYGIGEGATGHIGVNTFGVMGDLLQSPLLSGIERYKLGWIDPAEFDSTSFSNDTTIVLKDCAVYGDEGYAILRTQDEDQYFLLEARNEGSVYTTQQPPDGALPDCCKTNGSKPGLLVTHIYEGGKRNWAVSPVGAPPVYDVELIGGMFASNGAPDPVAGVDTLSSVNRLFTPTSAVQLGPAPDNGSNVFGPFTNPSSNLYASLTDSDQDVVSGWTIYNVDWAGPGNDSMLVSLALGATTVAAADTLPASMSWEGTVQLTGDLVVPSGVELDVTDSTRIYASADDRLQTGVDLDRVELVVHGKLDIEPTAAAQKATLSSSRDSSFDHFRGPGETLAASSSDWYGVRLSEIDSLGLGKAEFSHARAAIAVEESEWPDLAVWASDLSFTDNLTMVSFDRDVTIAGSSDSVTIAAGWTLGGAAGRDAGSSGLANDRVELKIEGVLVAEGTSSDKITFRSDDPDSGASDSGWYGLVWEVAAYDYEAAGLGYGFAHNSRLDHVNVQDAEHGLSFRDTGAPSITNTTFSNNNSSDMLADSTDVVIPSNGSWTLDAPVDIRVRSVAKSGKDLSANGGTLTAGKIDILASGKLETSGAADTLVTFMSTNTDANLGDIWGGMYFDWYRTDHRLNYVEVAHAETPLFLYYQNGGMEIQDSKIHHFKDEGIYAVHSNVLVQASEIYREDANFLVDDQGKTGIVFEECDGATLRTTTITISGQEDSVSTAGGAAVHVMNGKTWCDTQPSSAESLKVVENTLIGPGSDAETGPGKWSGIKMEWICGGTTRKPYISENLIRGWNKYGLDFYQSSNTQVSCNTVDSTAFGVEFTRDSGAVGQAVRFRSNQIDIESEFGQSRFVVRSDDANKSTFGPAAVYKGNNKMIARGPDDFFVENDPDPLGTINARDNYWLRNGTSYTVVDSILSHCSTDISDPVRMNVSGALLTEPQINCVPSGTQAVREESTVDTDTFPERSTDGRLWPTTTEIVRVQPNPGRGGTTVEFTAKDHSTAVQLQVFDVTGRRVRDVFAGDAPRGVNRVSWDGRDGQGREVASGIYFVQLKSGETRSTQRFVVLR